MVFIDRPGFLGELSLYLLFQFPADSKNPPDIASKEDYPIEWKVFQGGKGADNVPILLNGKRLTD